MSSRNRITLEPTGILSLELWNYCSERLRRGWRDNERAKLEEYLPASIAGMMTIALAARSRRDAEEKKEQARQKRIDGVRAVLEQIEKEAKKIKALEREAIAWHRAERIRKYVAAMRSSAVKDAQLVEWA
jgi:macrodomain Ter protein organizer (MatP/YcbG family)